MMTSAAQCGAGRIGPNAVIRAAEALQAIEGDGAALRIFRRAGLESYLSAAPAEMVPETEVAALHHALRAECGPARARSIAWLAGLRTAEYLLAHRIPRPVQTLLRVLPRAVACRVLMRAIAGNAWTFVGTGHFACRPGNPTRIRIDHCPLCRGEASVEPCCDFFGATFERLFAALVHPQAQAIETACAAQGAAACEFIVSWPD